ncbi:MAG: DUF1273 domain-containing protein [Ruminococcaceae bacterium]|nr:DUF1273 domain-containing protein [Oscillospiraceae bacterium]
MVIRVNFDDRFENDYFDGADFDIEFDEASVSAEPFFEYDNKRCSCSFTGHRSLTPEETRSLVPKLKSTVLYLSSLGVKEFHCGGAIGFDTLAATVVYDLSREHTDIKLVLELPYENQSKGWNETNRRFYDFVKSKAHEINIHGENPKNREQAVKLLLSRNRLMIDKSHYCVCYLKDMNAKKGGTAYTVNYAKLHDLQIINLAGGESPLTTHGKSLI